jgi:hypothetical protein
MIQDVRFERREPRGREPAFRGDRRRLARRPQRERDKIVDMRCDGPLRLHLREREFAHVQEAQIPYQNGELLGLPRDAAHDHVVGAGRKHP